MDLPAEERVLLAVSTCHARRPTNMPAVWTLVAAPSANRDLWVQLDEAAPFNDPRWAAWVAEGRLPEGSVPLFVPLNGGKRVGDMLWTGGLGIKLVSRKLLSILEEASATGFRVFPVTVEDRAGADVGSFFGIVASGHEQDDIRALDHGKQAWGMLVSERVVRAMKGAGCRVDYLEPLPAP